MPDEARTASRKGWGLGAVDDDELTSLSVEELRQELRLTMEIKAPLDEFEGKARHRLGELAHQPAPAPAPTGPDKVELHRHADAVVLPDGRSIVAMSFHRDDPYRRVRQPAWGLYFDSYWAPPWPHDHVEWPDMGTPLDTADLVAALASVYRRLQDGELVEVGCVGGHGRTGTALRLLACLAGLGPGEDPVAWVRGTYCPDAIETADQETLARSLGT